MQTLVERQCAVCGPNTPSRLKYPAKIDGPEISSALFDARQMELKPHFAFHECAKCGLHFSNPGLSENSLSSLYEDSHVNSYQTLEPHILNSYAPILDRAVARLSRRGTFVEIGGGTGFMLKAAVERGFEEQIEIEPSREAQSLFSPPSTRARFICSAFGQGMLADDSVSLLCFFQVLDHLANPLAFLMNAEKALEPNGVVVTVLHNTAAISAKLLGRRSPIYGVWHTYLFNPKNVKKLFQAAGFTHIDVFAIKNNYPAEYWCYESPVPQRLKQMGKRFLAATGLGAAKIPLYAGNIAVIASKRRKHNA